MNEKFQKAITKIQEGLKKDPRWESFQGREGGRDELFTQRVVEWIQKLESSPSEILLLAAWGHTQNRWTLERSTYPMNTKGYHQWRFAQSKLSANEAEKILRDCGYNDEIVQKVCTLILKSNFPKDPDSQVLEDAACLAFMEMKYESYIPEWGEEKYIRILKGTLEKMTPRAQTLALKISYSPAGRQLLEKAKRSR